MSSGKELAKILAKHFDVDANAEELSEFMEDEDFNLEDGTVVKVLEQGSDYSEVDPDVNPMSVVFEFQFKSGIRWLLLYGHYISHAGGYWDGYREVKQKQKVVTIYE